MKKTTPGGSRLTPSAKQAILLYLRLREEEVGAKIGTPEFAAAMEAGNLQAGDAATVAPIIPSVALDEP